MSTPKYYILPFAVAYRKLYGVRPPLRSGGLEGVSRARYEQLRLQNHKPGVRVNTHGAVDILIGHLIFSATILTRKLFIEEGLI